MKRIITGVMASAAWLLLLFLGPFPLFWLAITALAGVALAEYLAIVLPDLSRRTRVPLILFGLLPLVGVYSGETTGLLCGLTFALIALLLHTLSRYANLAHPYEVISRGGFGYLYLGMCSAHLVLLLALPQGRAWLLLLTAITAASDTAAFYTGSKFGKHKLCPAISPGKTWEGFLGGLVGSLAAALLVRHFFLPEQSLLWICSIVLLLGCLGAAGDLSESVIKRAFGVKDSGSILPGHGGLLDRIDSLLLTAPLLFYLLYFQTGLCLR
ncbi:MAG: phosphatidate cytidylyltransferase [Desulfobulbaceae bacterium]|nr:phosphatidate cytidylyltransferase [Desulfobulbaceae bacterium]HIJ90726.1 phosphatidate cytidylyltransferase [Deltaproteobacteria bacterium]